MEIEIYKDEMEFVRRGKVADLEIWPMKREAQADGSTWSEPCEAKEADFWTVTGNRKDGLGTVTLLDCRNEETAQSFAQKVSQSFDIPISYGLKRKSFQLAPETAPTEAERGQGKLNRPTAPGLKL